MKFSTVPGQSALVNLYFSKQKNVRVKNLRVARSIVLLDAVSESKRLCILSKLHYCPIFPL